MEHCYRRWQIREFYFMDDDLTADKERARQICEEIIRRKLKITWSASTGLRSENLDEEMLRLMKRSGCGLIALSPESGSPRVLTQLYGKNLDLKHIRALVRFAHQIDLRTIVYFVVGCQGETRRDRAETARYIIDLTKAGMDELGLFVFITHPETALTKGPYHNQLNVARWEDLVQGTVPLSHAQYRPLKRYKTKIYFLFFAFQLLYHPAKIFRLFKNFILNRQQTKSDRALVMIVKVMLLDLYLKGAIRAGLKPFRFLVKIADYLLGKALIIFLMLLKLLRSLKAAEKFTLTTYRRLIEFIYSIKINREYYFRLYRKRLLKCRGVFPADIAVTTRMLIDYLRGQEQLYKNKAVLDLGAGTGAIGLELDSFGSLELADIDRAAIKNLYINTNDRPGNIRITQSDLFGNIGRSFDTIIWNLPYFRPLTKQFIRSLHRRDEELPEFFSQAAARLNPGGAIIISYSSLADLGELRAAAGNNGFSYRIVKEKPLIFETLYVIELWQNEKSGTGLNYSKGV
jgi:tRNA1(Val) A37 N6-methylase TrmN6